MLCSDTAASAAAATAAPTTTAASGGEGNSGKSSPAPSASAAGFAPPTITEGAAEWALGATTKSVLHHVMMTIFLVISTVEVVVSPASNRANRLTAVENCSGFASGDQKGKDFFEHYPEARASRTVEATMASLTGPPGRNTSFGPEFLSERFLHAYAALKKSRGEPVSEHLAKGFIPMADFHVSEGKWYYTGALAVPEVIEWVYREGAVGLIVKKHPVFFPYSDRPAQNQVLQPLWDIAGFTPAMVIKIKNPGKFTVLNAMGMKREGHVWEATVAKLRGNVEKLSKGVEGFDVEAAVKALLNYHTQGVKVHPVGDCIGETSETMTGQDFLAGMQQHDFDFATATAACGYMLLGQECVCPKDLQCVGFLPAGEVYHVHVGDKILKPRGKVTLEDGSQKKVGALVFGDNIKDEGVVTTIEVWPRYTGVYHWMIANLEGHNDILAARKAAAAVHYYGEDVPASGAKKRSSVSAGAPKKRVKFAARAVSSKHHFVDDTKKNLDAVEGRDDTSVYHTPTHSKIEVEGETRYATTGETIDLGNPDGLLYNQLLLTTLLAALALGDTLWLDVDKCFDGWISLSRKTIYDLANMTQLYQEQGITDALYNETRDKMIVFLEACAQKGVNVVFWTANNKENTIGRFRDYWKIPADILNKCGLVYGRRDGADTPKHLLIAPHIDAGFPTIGDLLD